MKLQHTEPRPADGAAAGLRFRCERALMTLSGEACAKLWCRVNLDPPGAAPPPVGSSEALKRKFSPCTGCQAGGYRAWMLGQAEPSRLRLDQPPGVIVEVPLVAVAAPRPKACPVPAEVPEVGSLEVLPAAPAPRPLQPPVEACASDADPSTVTTAPGAPMATATSALDLTPRQAVLVLLIHAAEQDRRPFPTLREVAEALGAGSVSTGHKARVKLEHIGMVEATGDSWRLTEAGRRMARALKAKASSTTVPVEASVPEACEAPPAAPEPPEATATDEHSGELVIDVQPLAPEQSAAPLLPPAPIPPPEAAAPAPQEDPMCNRPPCAPVVTDGPGEGWDELRARIGLEAPAAPAEQPKAPTPADLPAYAHRAIARRSAHRLRLEAEREVARIFDNAGKLVAVQLRDGWPVEDAIAHLLASAELKVCDLVEDVVQNPGSLATPPPEASR